MEPRAEGDTSSIVPAAVREALGRDLQTGTPWKLAGGAMHDSWAVDASNASEAHQLVVRVSPAGRADHEKTFREYAVLKAMWDRGVAVPEPLAVGEAPGGESYLVMTRVRGDANPRRLIADPTFARARERMLTQLAKTLAAIHGVTPSEVSAELEGPAPGEDPIVQQRKRIEEDYHSYLLNPHPAIEWAFRWVDRQIAALAPRRGPALVVHGDYRIGNLMYDEDGLVAVLDWEGVMTGEPEEDLAWFCTRVWRFGNHALEAGGIARREDWVRAYERASGRTIDRDRLRVWEVLMNIRWAELTMMQAQSHLQSQVRSHELAAIGRRTAETELEILRLTGVVEAARAG